MKPDRETGIDKIPGRVKRPLWWLGWHLHDRQNFLGEKVWRHLQGLDAGRLSHPGFDRASRLYDEDWR